MWLLGLKAVGSTPRCHHASVESAVKMCTRQALLTRQRISPAWQGTLDYVAHLAVSGWRGNRTSINSISQKKQDFTKVCEQNRKKNLLLPRIAVCVDRGILKAPGYGKRFVSHCLALHGYALLFHHCVVMSGLIEASRNCIKRMHTLLSYLKLDNCLSNIFFSVSFLVSYLIFT